jgi:hypothetical protein
MTAKVLIAIAFALALPATAAAGGWATVQLGSMPTGTAPGEPWKTDLTILQHGRTPLDNVQPGVIVRGPGGEKRFDAKPNGKPGGYSVSVVFPKAGRYEFLVDDGFGNMGAVGHTYNPVDIGGAPAAAVPPATPRPQPAADGNSYLWVILFGAFAIAASVALSRRGRSRSAPKPAL